jgi:amino acid adenylation domain-containing protein
MADYLRSQNLARVGRYGGEFVKANSDRRIGLHGDGMRLEHLLEAGAARTPDAVAALEVGGTCASYRELDQRADAIASALRACGVGPGDRVGLCTPKRILALAAVFGALKTGAAYVPVDYTAPAARNGYIFNDCMVRAVVTDRACLDALKTELQGEWRLADLPGAASETGAFVILARKDATAAPKSPDLAYILYTSGSTGRPKGVTHSHATALAFIDWCSEAFQPTPGDRFSSHAPFHFDLSILDIYVPLKHGASVVLFDSEAGKQPATLARAIAELRITIWYSTPSILRMLLEYGKLEEYDCASLRIVNFAGEVFPIKHLRALMERWPHPQYFNLYGPTETNVCTYYSLRAPLPESQTTPLPIGRKCSGDETCVVDPDGAIAARGEEGELVVAGGSVMLGYWNLPERNVEAFVEFDGRRWYRTGDVVREDENGDYVFLGRRDRMVKRRGYRVELGEIEAALHAHPAIPQAAVIARPSADGDTEIIAFVVWADTERMSLVRMKQFCAGKLPIYMIPDRFVPLPDMPKTSTDKIDYQRLKDMA